MCRQRRQIIGIVIQVVAVAYLRGSAMTTAVMRDDAIAVLEEKQHLGVPVIGRQRPAVAEHDGLTFAPILVKDLDAVFGCNCAHGTSCKSALLRMRSSSSPLTQKAINSPRRSVRSEMCHHRLPRG